MTVLAALPDFDTVCVILRRLVRPLQVMIPVMARVTIPVMARVMVRAMIQVMVPVMARVATQVMVPIMARVMMVPVMVRAMAAATATATAMDQAKAGNSGEGADDGFELVIRVVDRILIIIIGTSIPNN